MTDKEIIERLAKRMDWKNVSCSRNGLNWFGIPPEEAGPTKASMPDWLNSLDALQPVLANLTDEEWGSLTFKLQVRAAADRELLELSQSAWGITKMLLTIPLRVRAEAVAEAIKEAEV